MKLIVCTDLNNGILFNNRRQSRDKLLIEHIYNLVGENKLWITEFSKNLFEEGKYNLFEIDNIENIKEDDFVFIENYSPKILEEKLNEIILFNWNRNYPADLYFDISLDSWKLESEIEIEGSSHEKITQKIYRRENNG